MAHLNTTGQQVPVWINADPADHPHIGFGMAYESGLPYNIHEGVFMGNILTANPPVAKFARGPGFKASIEGRLGSGTNIYKALDGYTNNNYYNGSAFNLCRKEIADDGIHHEFESCYVFNQNGSTKYNFRYNISTWVNSNYDGSVSQNWSSKTLNFQSGSMGEVVSNGSDVYTHNGFDFSNSIGANATGRLFVENVDGSRRLCVRNSDDIVITRNAGEPFSLTSLDLKPWFGSSSSAGSVTIRGYKKSGSSPLITSSVWLNGSGSTVSKTLNWDGVIKVEIAAPQSASTCIDNVKVKT
jgi:hypothetical protein